MQDENDASKHYTVAKKIINERFRALNLWSNYRKLYQFNDFYKECDIQYFKWLK